VRLAFINTRIQYLGSARNALSHSHWSRADVLISWGMVQRISWPLRRDTDALRDQQRRRAAGSEANQEGRRASKTERDETGWAEGEQFADAVEHLRELRAKPVARFVGQFSTAKLRDA
jgi:hypothetical protein